MEGRRERGIRTDEGKGGKAIVTYGCLSVLVADWFPEVSPLAANTVPLLYFPEPLPFLHLLPPPCLLPAFLGVSG